MLTPLAHPIPKIDEASTPPSIRVVREGQAALKLRNSTRRIVPWILAISLAALAAGSFLFYRMGLKAGGASATPAATAQRVSMVDGVPVVTVDGTMQQQSGMRTEALSAISHQAEASAYGTVLDLQPLIDLRSRFVSTRGDVDVAKAAAFASGQQLQRNRTLYREQHAVSLQAVQAAEAAYLADEARLKAAQRNSENIRSLARQRFGEPLAGWALANSPEFERLASRQEVLVRVTLPPGDESHAPTDIQLGAQGGRMPAHLLSASPESDPTIQGRAFIYRAAAAIAADTNLVAYLPVSSQALQGIIIPGAAIVWHAGKPWVYVQMAPDRFARRPVDRHSPMNDGFFVTEGFQAGDRIVVTGAQLLLSEELRPTPGAGCKDPECD